MPNSGMEATGSQGNEHGKSEHGEGGDCSWIDSLFEAHELINLYISGIYYSQLEKIGLLPYLVMRYPTQTSKSEPATILS